MDALSAKVREILAAELQAAPQRIQASTSLRDELSMDSIAALNILFAAQEAFGVEIPEGEVASVRTVADVEALIRSHLAGRPPGNDG